jgi:hypothetical protein
MSERHDRTENEDRRHDPNRPETADDGPVQTRRSDEAPDRQIAQERQQSTGQGTGQS